MPKHTDDKIAREVATTIVSTNDASPDAIVSAFQFVEFETSTSRVGGEDVTLRRVVLVGPWEVVNN